jgi:hypothetical protein
LDSDLARSAASRAGFFLYGVLFLGFASIGQHPLDGRNHRNKPSPYFDARDVATLCRRIGGVPPEAKKHSTGVGDRHGLGRIVLNCHLVLLAELEPPPFIHAVRNSLVFRRSLPYMCITNKELRMATRRKRAPGGGRKPKGDFSRLESPVSVRMPQDMRTQLEAAARRSGRSVSQELLTRLDISLNKDRNKAVDPAMRAINFLISSLAYAVHWNMPNWRSDRFLFRAIKIGINKLLDALEPSGEMKLPDFWRAYADMLNDENTFEGNETLLKARDAMRKQIIEAIRSPEAMADHAVSATLQNYASPRPQKNFEALRENWEDMRGLASLPGWKEISGKILKHQEDLYYGMNDARKDLRIKGEKS